MRGDDEKRSIKTLDPSKLWRSVAPIRFTRPRSGPPTKTQKRKKVLMAFTLEDGSGVEGANAYIDVSFYRDHHTDRGNTAHSDFTDTDTMAGIIRAFGESSFVVFVRSRGRGLSGRAWMRSTMTATCSTVPPLSPHSFRRQLPSMGSGL